MSDPVLLWFGMLSQAGGRARSGLPVDVACPLGLGMNDAAFYLQTRNWSRRCRHILQEDSDSSNSSVDYPEEENQFPDEYKFVEPSHCVQVSL